MSGDGGATDVHVHVAVTSPVDVCAVIEGLGGDAVGELVLADGDAAVGSVFVECGRVCWAAARGLARRFTELLVSSSGASRAAIEEVVLGCVAERVPLGERLLAAGLVDAGQLRCALLEHTAESLAIATVEPAAATWCPRRRRGYASRFTFGTAEVLARALTHDRRTDAALGAAVVERSFAPEECAAAFARCGDRAAPLPVAIAGAWPTDTRGLLRVGRWSASAIDLARDGGGEPLVAATRGGRSVVAFAEGHLLVAGVTSELGAARILTRRARVASRRDLDGGV